MKFRIIATLVILIILIVLAIVAKPLVFPDSNDPHPNNSPKQSSEQQFKL